MTPLTWWTVMITMIVLWNIAVGVLVWRWSHSDEELDREGLVWQIAEEHAEGLHIDPDPLCEGCHRARYGGVDVGPMIEPAVDRWLRDAHTVRPR